MRNAHVAVVVVRRAHMGGAHGDSFVPSIHLMRLLHCRGGGRGGKLVIAQEQKVVAAVDTEKVACRVCCAWPKRQKVSTPRGMQSQCQGMTGDTLELYLGKAGAPHRWLEVDELSHEPGQNSL